MTWKARNIKHLNAITIDDEQGDMICTLDCEGWTKEKKATIAALIESAPLLKEIVEDMLRIDIDNEHRAQTTLAAHQIINYINKS